MSAPKDALTAPRMALRTAIILFVFVVLFTGLLSAVYWQTLPTINAAASEEKMKLIDEVLPRQHYDNALLKDTLSLPPTAAFGQDEASIVYRARQMGEDRALVFECIAPDGYAGKIRLLVALDADGRLLGVRVVQHKETPGLGDYIDPKKDKNKAHPWILQLDGLQAARVSEGEWKVKKDGGRFDSLAGATVSPRAVLKAVRRAETYVAENRPQLFAPALVAAPSNELNTEPRTKP